MRQRPADARNFHGAANECSTTERHAEQSMGLPGPAVRGKRHDHKTNVNFMKSISDQTSSVTHVLVNPRTQYYLALPRDC